MEIPRGYEVPYQEALSQVLYGMLWERGKEGCNAYLLMMACLKAWLHDMGKFRNFMEQCAGSDRPKDASYLRLEQHAEEVLEIFCQWQLRKWEESGKVTGGWPARLSCFGKG
jgi:hypothetical protein